MKSMLYNSTGGNEKVLPKLDKILWPMEKVTWRGEPYKKAYLFPALGGFFFGLFLTSITVFFYLFVGPSSEFWPSSLFLILMFGAFGAFFAVVLPLYYLKKYPNTEYLLTNKRLIIRSEFSKRFEFLSLFDSMVQGLNSWFAELGEIKEIRVKKGKFWDKIFGAASIYPITPDFPYDLLNIPPPEGEFSTVVFKADNVVSGKKEKVPDFLLWQKTYQRPRMEALKKPYEIEKLIREAINEQKQNM